MARIIIDGVGEEQLSVTHLCGDVYRLDDTPMLLGHDFETPDAEQLLWRGDTIEAEVLEDGALRYRSVVAKSPWRHLSWMLSKGVVGSVAIGAFTNAVERHGGSCERIMGGLLIVHLPENSTFDAEVELDAWVKRAGRQPAEPDPGRTMHSEGLKRSEIVIDLT